MYNMTRVSSFCLQCIEDLSKKWLLIIYKCPIKQKSCSFVFVWTLKKKKLTTFFFNKWKILDVIFGLQNFIFHLLQKLFYDSHLYYTLLGSILNRKKIRKIHAMKLSKKKSSKIKLIYSIPFQKVWFQYIALYRILSICWCYQTKLKAMNYMNDMWKFYKNLQQKNDITAGRKCQWIMTHIHLWHIKKNLFL